MVRRWRWVLIAVIVCAVGMLAVSGNTALRYLGLLSDRQSPVEVADLLAPHMHAQWPEGDGPFPTALLLSGCDGPADNLEVLADGLEEIGWASVIVDSHGARGLTDRATWSLVCAGQLFTGTERAGDLAVALDVVRGWSDVDPGQIAMIGASHGGWTVLDLLALHGHEHVPPTLTDWPPSVLEHGLEGVQEAVLYYPYCGPGSRVWRWSWRAPIPALFLLVEDDSVANEDDCLQVASDAAEAGLPVTVETFTGVTHGFDQAEKAPLSVLGFDPDAREDALNMVQTQLAMPPAPGQ